MRQSKYLPDYLADLWMEGPKDLYDVIDMLHTIALEWAEEDKREEWIINGMSKVLDLAQVELYEEGEDQ